MSSVGLPGVFTEMLRSFVTLGETQNLSHSVTELGISRQTIRRHVREIERLKGGNLFEESDRQYRPTPKGAQALAEATKLLEYSRAWLDHRPTGSYGLLNTEIEICDDSWVYAQQHPLMRVWSQAPPILRRGLECWSLANGTLESEAFEKIRPYILVFRKHRGEWVIVEVGEKSAYGTWLGMSVAKSELGRPLELGEKYDKAVAYWRKPYDAVLESGSLWYEHISLSLPRKIGAAPVPVNYHRLIAACSFPDGQAAVMVFAARTDNIIIPNMPQKRSMPNLPENLMEFEI